MFFLKRIMPNARTGVIAFRTISSTSPIVGVEVDNEGIATVTMQRPPVNSLNLELLQDLCKAFDEVSKNKCKAMILTSSLPTVFSAGIDIMEVYKPDMKRAEMCWNALQEVWLKLFGSKFITAAAINGHAPAGGCILAASCEYRVMMKGTDTKFTIGAKEAALGLIAPKWFMDTMKYTCRQREIEVALTTARMFTAEEALKMGLINETSTDKADSIAKCKKFIKKFDRIPPLARAITKQKLREVPLAWLQNNRAMDTKEFLSFIENPTVQQSIEMYVQRLKENMSK